MERKDFIEQVGLSSAAILIFGCLQACSKSGSTSVSNNNTGTINTSKVIDYTININVTPYDALLKGGGFYLDTTNSIIIARTLNNEFLAVSSICTHQQNNVEYQPSKNQFYCPAHGSMFSAAGAVSMGPATLALKQYKTSLTGTNLRIYA